MGVGEGVGAALAGRSSPPTPGVVDVVVVAVIVADLEETGRGGEGVADGVVVETADAEVHQGVRELGVRRAPCPSL